MTSSSSTTRGPIRDDVPLGDAFFNPEHCRERHRPAPQVPGLGECPGSRSAARRRRAQFSVRPSGAGGLDLAALNIQHSRDHGLADYNSVRKAFGLRPGQRCGDHLQLALQETLEALYGDVDNIDLWVGGLAEDHVPGSSVGPTFQRILVDQFTRLRDADRYWYQVGTVPAGSRIDNTTLANVIRRNTDVANLQDNVFFDASVLYVEAPAGSRGLNLAVVASEESVELIDQGTNEVLASRPASGLSQVILVGSGGRDRVLVEGDQAGPRSPTA